MRKVVLNLTMSLDGFIEGPDGEYDWCFTDQDYGMTHFLARTDSVFCGRKSYDLLTRVGDEILTGKDKYVFSETLTEVEGDWVLVRDQSGESIRAILNRPGKDIWLFGGSSLTRHFIQLNLVDEMILSIHPVLLGGGTPMFYPADKRNWLEVADCKHYNTGLVQITYRFKLR